jgi:hypothetical protein
VKLEHQEADDHSRQFSVARPFSVSLEARGVILAEWGTPIVAGGC